MTKENIQLVRTVPEIQYAHDVLSTAIEDLNVLASIVDRQSISSISGALSVLCWMLGHDDIFGENVDEITRGMARLGITSEPPAEDTSQMKVISHQRYGADMLVSGFVALYDFWQALSAHSDEAGREFAMSVLRRLGLSCLTMRGGVASNRIELAAYRYVGLSAIAAFKESEESVQ
ncbi:MAG TPA: hypothetical protein VI455_02150 [Terriglobia bacterium]